MGLLEAIRGKLKVIVSAALGLATLPSMGIVRKTGISGHKLVTDLSDESKEEGDKPDDISIVQATIPPPKRESMDIEATAIAEGPHQSLIHFSLEFMTVW